MIVMTENLLKNGPPLLRNPFAAAAQKFLKTSHRGHGHFDAAKGKRILSENIFHAAIVRRLGASEQAWTGSPLVEISSALRKG